MEEEMIYGLNIFYPDNRYDVMAHLLSTKPFQTISVGDYIDPRSFQNCGDLATKLLKVVLVQHTITELENGKIGRHQILVFTEAVPNEEEFLFPRSAE